MDADVPAASVLAPDPDDVVAVQFAPMRTGDAGLRVLLALGCGTFVAALVFIVPTPFFPLMARDLQVSVPLLGQVMTAMLLLSALFGLVVGPLADRSGYRRLMLIGLVAAVVCLFAFGLAPSFPVLVLASIAGAVTTAAVLGPSMAIATTAFTGTVISITGAALAMGLEVVGMITLLTGESPSGSGTTLSLNVAVFNLNAAGGGAIGGVLLAMAGYDAVASGLPLFALAAALLTWRSTRAGLGDQVHHPADAAREA